MRFCIHHWSSDDVKTLSRYQEFTLTEFQCMRSNEFHHWLLLAPKYDSRFRSKCSITKLLLHHNTDINTCMMSYSEWVVVCHIDCLNWPLHDQYMTSGFKVTVPSILPVFEAANRVIRYDLQPKVRKIQLPWDLYAITVEVRTQREHPRCCHQETTDGNYGGCFQISLACATESVIQTF